MNWNDFGFKIDGNILKGEEVVYENEYTSLGEFILTTLKSNLNLVGQVEVATGKSQTQRETIDRSVRCALWMKSQGLIPGHVVTICSHNQLDVPTALFATLFLRAVVSPLDVGMNAKDIARLLELTKAKIAFVARESATVVAEAAREVGCDLKIVVFGRVPGFVDFEAAIAEPGMLEVETFRITPTDSLDDIALIMCSSGTTGASKGVALSHGALLRQINCLKQFGYTAEPCLVFSTISWISGVIFLFTNLATNATRIIPPSFDEHSACELMQKYKISSALFGTSMINRLLKIDFSHDYDLSSLKRVIYGGAPLAMATRKALAELLPNTAVAMVYGLTEIGGLFSIQVANSKPDSCGSIVPNAQLKVIDPEIGRTLGPNQKGELLLKSLSMMNSYYGNPKATAQTVDGEGWLHSGDLGYFDEDGDIFVIERLKELIKYRGHHVAPIEIENLILTHPGVKEVSVVGVPHPIDDEHPVAFVVRKNDSSGIGRQVSGSELIDLVTAKLSDSKRLRGGVKFVDQLPKSHSGKIQRQILRDLANP